MTDKQIASKLTKAERQARALLGTLSEIALHYDSMRTASASGHVAQAASDLKQAALIARIIARKG